MLSQLPLSRAHDGDQRQATVRTVMTAGAALVLVVTARPSPGRAGDDLIIGTAGSDRILGMAGDDTICGGDGADLIFGDDIAAAQRHSGA
jgi:hypothetical protein